MSKRLTSGLAAALLLVGACNYHADKAQKGRDDDARRGDGGPTDFQALGERLFGPSCHRCHNPGRTSGGVDLTSFPLVREGAASDGEALVRPGSSATSRLYRVVADGVMPPRGTVPAEAVALLACWIDAGATEDGATCASADATPAPSTVTFTSLTTSLFANPTYRCTKCHSAERAAGGLDLTSYDVAVAGKDDILAVLVAGTMPPRGPAVPPELTEEVRQWIAAGAPR